MTLEPSGVPRSEFTLDLHGYYQAITNKMPWRYLLTMMLENWGKSGLRLTINVEHAHSHHINNLLC